MSVRFAVEVDDTEISLAPSPTPIYLELSAIYSLDQDEDSLYTNQILDILFECTPNEKLGFHVRPGHKMLQVSSVAPESEAHLVGLKQGDIILAVNDENVGQNPQIGIDELKKARSSTEVRSIRITICRRIFDHILVKVQRSGIEKCNGKYTFAHLDEDFDSPIFINQDNNMLLLKSNYDPETGESLWALCDETNMFYIASAMDLMPPNDSWSPVKKVGKYPSPGLVFYNTQQRLIEVEDKSDDSDHENEEEDNKSDMNHDHEMSPMQQQAMNNPHSFRTRHDRVFKTVMSLKNVLLDVDYDEDIEDDDEDENEERNEWKMKYNELFKKHKESEQVMDILRVNIKELNTSFYELWLKHKIEKEKNEEIVNHKDHEIKELKDKLQHLEQGKKDENTQLQNET